MPQVTITSTGGNNATGQINGLIAVSGATNGFGATALTKVTMLGGTDFVLGTTGSGQAGWPSPIAAQARTTTCST
ncbi:MAG: hypothetical protein U1E60_01740 [Reyranellaceae bacterium]